MRSRMARTTAFVIAAYICCWLPYNVSIVAKNESRSAGPLKNFFCTLKFKILYIFVRNSTR